MGWDYTHKPSNVKEYFMKKFTFVNGTRKVTALDCKLKNFAREAYLAVKSEGEQGTEVFAVVVLINYKGSFPYTFGYKSMEESMRPFYYNCPQSIIEQLSHTTNENSLKWREACIAK